MTGVKWSYKATSINQREMSRKWKGFVKLCFCQFVRGYISPRITTSSSMIIHRHKRWQETSVTYSLLRTELYSSQQDKKAFEEQQQAFPTRSKAGNICGSQVSKIIRELSNACYLLKVYGKCYEQFWTQQALPQAPWTTALGMTSL